MRELIKGLKMAVPYLRMFKGEIFVIKLGGEVLDNEKVMENFAGQIALLHQLNIKVVLVHGGGVQATELSKKLGIPVETIGGRRITNAQTLDVVKMVFNKLNTDILAALRKQMVPGVGISGVDGELIKAHKRPLTKMRDDKSGEEKEVDFGFVGDVVSLNPKIITHLLDGSFVPVVSSMAGNEDGDVFNINADTIAVRLAAKIGALKLIILMNQRGVLENPDDPNTLISYMNKSRLDEVIKNSAHGGMLAKLSACKEALELGVPKTQIISCIEQDSLLIEIFTNEGSGTLIENEET